ncbi:MAG: hypothetical protein BGP01_02110 [Paludibacter sp. 47-17]|nr:MAG: hypothetical protein F9K10_01830 [Paludibacter sp.]OJX91644.1 MAG: hypothetical protein BGP01_02110 [Paludibacter sp. 47-17]
MKKLICLSVIVMGLLLVSCEKSSDSQVEKKNESAGLLEKARQFSKQHDQLVLQMMELDKELLRKGVSSAIGSAGGRLREQVLQVVFQVTGIKPEIADPGSQKVLQASSGDPGYFWVSLDTDAISLAPYAESSTGLQFLGSVDDLVEDQNLSLEEKLDRLELLSAEAANNTQLGTAEMERVLTTIEVLKGSLQLWSSFPEQAPSLSPAQGLMKVSIRDWSRWKKLGFVAAADAVGGALGFFLGGYIVVNGVPVYLPAGPTGLAGTAAALSFIAAKMVGW